MKNKSVVHVCTSCMIGVQFDFVLPLINCVPKHTERVLEESIFLEGNVFSEGKVVLERNVFYSGTRLFF